MWPLQLLLLSIPGLVRAWGPPAYCDWQLIWADAFPGPGGTLPDRSKWNIIDAFMGVNNELETYMARPHEVQISGGSTVQLVPWRNSTAKRGWTSGRLESNYTFVPQPCVQTMAEGLIRFGPNAITAKKGIWPAFWILGDSIRHGTGWPKCGELDILETINGQLTGYGTAHCDVYPGGACNEPNGRGATVPIPNQEWQRWRIVWDRTPNSWQCETITWFMNDLQFHKLYGSQIGDADIWASLTQRPLFFILNVAVGGDWPGNPNDATLDGYCSMMEVAYVGLYSSARRSYPLIEEDQSCGRRHHPHHPESGAGEDSQRVMDL